ncbi:MAG TPA: hypothetical protein GX719_08230 [Gammaproteobacteria bacterium]|nr:hypothetical protein [Gammaproteobacteria bacterium]
MIIHGYLWKAVFFASLLSVSLAAAGQNPTLQPISTHFGQTQTEVSVELTANSFSNVELDEADNFDGYSAALELTMPFATDKQIRFSVPFYTKGDADLKTNGRNIDIDGIGGVFDYSTLQFEQQKYFAEESGFNLSYAVGGGMRTAALDTTINDYYNHTGKIALLGIKMDKPIHTGETQLLLNVGIRYYFDADDLHPRGIDSWAWADIKGAVVFKPWGQYVRPALELTYLGGFNDYNAVSLMPELIIQMADNASLKLGGILGLTSDGNQGGVTGQLSISF